MFWNIKLFDVRNKQKKQEKTYSSSPPLLPTPARTRAFDEIKHLTQHRLGSARVTCELAAATLPMWGGASALCLMSGAQNEDDSYKKSIAVQMHLMAWELPDTIMVRERERAAGVGGSLSSGCLCHRGPNVEHVVCQH